MSAYTCPQCNGNGIINYDSDLPRYKQEHCPLCEGEGVIHKSENPFPKIKEQLEKTRPDWVDNAIIELEKRLQKDTGKSIFTAIILENDGEDLEEDEEEGITILHVFTDKSVMQSFVTAQTIGSQLALRIRGNWL